MQATNKTAKLPDEQKCINNSLGFRVKEELMR